MNLYIFHTSSEAAVYGIGTYIRELTTALRHSKIKVCVVNLRAHVPQMQMEETSDGIKRWYFPEPIEQMATDLLNDLYYLKSASNLNGNLNCSKELEHYAS